MDTTTTTTPNTRVHVTPTHLRTLFSTALSSLYKTEVPLYATLTSLVSTLNNSLLASSPTLKTHLTRTNELSRLALERHGAIRLGTPDELRLMARFLGLLGMRPVGYYDLAPAGLPIHATCFRATEREALARNPFRLFVSMLRGDCVEGEVWRVVEDAVRGRRIFSVRAEELIALGEGEGGLTESEARDLVVEGLETFRWRGRARVCREVYERLLGAHPILADVAAFAGPHVNHLTPRVLDIEMVHGGMGKVGIPAKRTIEGPPRRECAILLRQTSFYAQRERFSFMGAAEMGYHTARFGEVEERGAALTAKGRALYDDLLEKALAKGVTWEDEEAYAKMFKAFPDDWKTIRQQGLAWIRYVAVPGARLEGNGTLLSMEELVEAGLVRAEPIVYEDFLPISAAGIFQSNLREDGRRDSGLPARPSELKDDGEARFAEAVGGVLLNEMDLYRAIQEESVTEVYRALGVTGTVM